MNISIMVITLYPLYPAFFFCTTFIISSIVASLHQNGSSVRAGTCLLRSCRCSQVLEQRLLYNGLLINIQGMDDLGMFRICPRVFLFDPSLKSGIVLPNFSF